jgi:hypothetical protein
VAGRSTATGSRDGLGRAVTSRTYDSFTEAMAELRRKIVRKPKAKQVRKDPEMARVPARTDELRKLIRRR